MVRGYSTIKRTYNSFVRPYLPRTSALRSRVVVPDSGGVLDLHKTEPRAEGGLVAGTATIRAGDEVVVVGAGHGVVTTWAARMVGDSGHVFAYEGADEQADTARNTVAANGLSERVTLKTAVVGSDINVYGEGEVSDEVIPPADLPACDVLILDCEGAELAILRGIDQRPRVVLVEVHPDLLDSSGQPVADWLAEQDYETIAYDHKGYPVPESEWDAMLANEDLDLWSNLPILVGVRREH